ncbi:MAG TPA: hypothetical protein VJR24_13880 [Gemmatimonadaceae bacterium]|nr:hypothetical protein [Gemmatimonadaceae bacterium]
MGVEQQSPRRVRMSDGATWTVEFQHERAQLMRRGRERERRLFVFFRDDRGETRRAVVPEDAKSSATDEDLRRAWESAERLLPATPPDAFR